MNIPYGGGPTGKFTLGMKVRVRTGQYRGEIGEIIQFRFKNKHETEYEVSFPPTALFPGRDWFDENELEEVLPEG